MLKKVAIVILVCALLAAIWAVGASIGLFSGIMLGAPDREKLAEVPDCFFLEEGDPEYPNDIFGYSIYLIEVIGVDPKSLSIEGACVVIDNGVPVEGGSDRTTWTKIWFAKIDGEWTIVREYCYLNCPYGGEFEPVPTPEPTPSDNFQI